LTETVGGNALFYAVASRQLQRTLAFYLTIEEAQAALESVVDEEPELAGDLTIVRIDFSAPAIVETVS
jgi:hypothetical protein